MAQPEKTEPLTVCVDADVLIAGLLSRTGASHAMLVLGERGLLRLVLPEATVADVRRNLAAKPPRPHHSSRSSSVLSRFRSTSRRRTTVNARELVDTKDVAILTAAIGAGACLLVTRQTLPFGAGSACRGSADAHRGGPRMAELAQDVRGRSPATGVRVGC